MGFVSKYWKQLAVCLALVCSFAAGYWSNNPEEIIRVEEKIVEKEVSKEKDEKTTSKQNDKIKVTTKKPDGSIETVEIDKGKKDTNESSERETVKETEKSKTETKVTAKSNFRAGLGIENEIDLRKLKWDPTYRVSGGVRMFGDFWLESSVNTKKDVGVGVSYEW